MSEQTNAQDAPCGPVDWHGEKKISLALQGGGSHGAFTWGVLDRILEDGRLDIEAITGTSAGAMNAVALMEGYRSSGRQGARESLERFWGSVCEEGRLTFAQKQLFDTFFGGWMFEKSPFQMWFNFFEGVTSPYTFNPLNINPLRDHLQSIVDFEKVRACDHIKLFIAATNVHTGRVAVFEREHLTADHVMASAALPLMFHAVEIDGIPYWDGGYMGNPALFPLLQKTDIPDILIVQINPIVRAQTPRTASDIRNRLNEITFNGALMGELRSINFVTRMIEQGGLEANGYVHPRMHRIEGSDELKVFSSATKTNTRWSFLKHLRDVGREAAGEWLDAHYDSVGKRATLDLKDLFS